MSARIGVIGLGAALPERVRRNEDWPDDLVAAWRAKREWSPDRASRAAAHETAQGAERVLAAMEALSHDPFQGSRERRYLGDGELVAELEERAARAALRDAELTPEDVEFVLGSTLIPDLMNAPNACALHHRLGLRPGCFTLAADAVCNSFQMQLTLAEALVRSGRYRCGLLTQSSAISRTTPMDAPFSVNFGDGATAVVVGPAREGAGLLAQAHRTDGTLNRAIVVSVEGGAWWEDGRVLSTTPDREAARRMFLSIGAVAEELMREALAVAGVRAADIDFFGAHQATAWWREVVQAHLGLEHARTHDTFARAGTLSAANLPFVLHEARAAGELAEGDLVALYQGGTGATYSFSILRW